MEEAGWGGVGIGGDSAGVPQVLMALVGVSANMHFTLEFNMQERAVAPPRREHFAGGRKQHILPDVLKCVVLYFFI